jgi:hypothetical protein
MLALVLAAVLPLLPADQGSSAAPDRVQPVLPTRSFSQLFTVQDLPSTGDKKVVTLETPRPGPKKKVVCGMTLIIVDGSVDPKMAIAPKGGKDVDPGMPRVPKPMCGEKR